MLCRLDLTPHICYNLTINVLMYLFNQMIAYLQLIYIAFYCMKLHFMFDVATAEHYTANTVY